MSKLPCHVKHVYHQACLDEYIKVQKNNQRKLFCPQCIKEFEEKDIVIKILKEDLTADDPFNIKKTNAADNVIGGNPAPPTLVHNPQSVDGSQGIQLANQNSADVPPDSDLVAPPQVLPPLQINNNIQGNDPQAFEAPQGAPPVLPPVLDRAGTLQINDNAGDDGP